MLSQPPSLSLSQQCYEHFGGGGSRTSAKEPPAVSPGRQGDRAAACPTSTSLLAGGGDRDPVLWLSTPSIPRAGLGTSQGCSKCSLTEWASICTGL